MSEKKPKKAKKAKTTVTKRPLDTRRDAPKTPLFAGKQARAAVTLFCALAILAVISVAPYFRGLFFLRERLIAFIASAAIFVSYLLFIPHAGKSAIIRNDLDKAALGLAGAYVLAIVAAASPKQAIAEALKYVNYFFVYWIISDLVAGRARAHGRADRAASTVLTVLLMSALGVAILGVGAAAGTLKYRGAYDGLRISSSIQYPNSLAAYLTAAFFLAVGLSASEKRPLGKAAYSAAACGVLLPFVFTYSRGAWALFPLVCIIFLLVLPKNERSGGFWLLAAALAVTLAASPFFHRALHPPVPAGGQPRGPVPHAVWLVYVLSIVLGGAASYVAYRISLLRNRSQALILAGVLLAIALALFVPAFRAPLLAATGSSPTQGSGPGGTAVGSPLGRLLPQDLLARLKSISLKEWSAASRFMWTVDALRIVKDYPIIGAGGGGWNAVYHAYQRWGYWTTEVHNYYAQTWVETGTVGLAALVAIWFFFFKALHRAYRLSRDGGPGEQVLLATVGCSAIALGAHSFIDFNLSLAGIGFFLWTLFGAGGALALSIAEGSPAAATDGRHRGAEFERASSAKGQAPPRSRSRGDEPPPRSKLSPRHGSAGASGIARAMQRPLAIIVSAVLAILAGCMLKAEAYGQQAAGLAKQNKLEEAREAYAAASKLDPWETAYRIDLATVNVAMAEKKKDPAPLAEARASLEKAVRLEPFNANTRARYGSLLLRTGAIEEGLRQMEEALRLQPFTPAMYENLAKAYLESGTFMYDRKRFAEAKQYFSAAAEVPARMKEKRSTIPASVPEPYRMPEITPAVALHAGKAAAMLGQTEAAKTLLEKAAADKKARAEAWTWLGALHEIAGDKAGAEDLKNKAKQADPTSAEQYPQIFKALTEVPKKLQANP